MPTNAKRLPTCPDEKRSLTRIIDGEFSSNVGKSSNHKVRSRLLMPGLQLRLRVGREDGRDLHGNEKLASENILVKVSHWRSEP
jgi:hypothetical protein